VGNVFSSVFGEKAHDRRVVLPFARGARLGQLSVAQGNAFSSKFVFRKEAHLCGAGK
jgi:hypothetical protein